MNKPQTESNSESDFNYLIGYILAVFRSRYLVILAFLISLLVSVFIATSFATRFYRSTAVVEISPKAPTVFDVKQVDEVGVSSASSNIRAYYGTQYRIIRSNLILSKTIQRLRDEHGITDFDDLKNPIPYLRSFMVLSPQRETTVVHLSFEYSDPDKSALFANTLVDVYMETNLERAFQAARDALKWLEKEHERYREATVQSQEQVHNYKFKEEVVGIDEQYKAVLETVATLQNAWSELHAKRIEQEAVQRDLQSQFRRGSLYVLAKRLSKDDVTISSLIDEREVLLQEQNRLSIRYLEQHPERVRVNAELDGLENLIQTQVQAVISSVESEVKTYIAQEEAVLAELENFRLLVKELDFKQLQLEELKSEAERNIKLYEGLDLRMSEVDLSQFIQANNIRIIDRAVPPNAHIRPSLSFNLLMALVLGLIGGCILAFLLELWDNSIKSSRDFYSTLGVPLLGAVFSIDDNMAEVLTPQERSLYAFIRPRSAIGEALRSIRTNVLFRLGTDVPKVILVTSSIPQEGKSFISSNLAAIMSMNDTRVLLIDADLRRPTIHRIFGMDNSVGLSDFLLGKKTVEQSIRKTKVPNLDMMMAGPIAPNPSELLDSEMMRQLPNVLSQYDIILLDTSPVNMVTDPIVLSQMVDGVIFVVKAGSTERPLIRTAISHLKDVNAPLIGGIVNQINTGTGRDGNYYYSGYYRHYGGYYMDEEELEEMRRLRKTSD
ncbi:MAG: polysaccharide biosynthesis tyrosine autokinase [Myxococcota bacterium]|nr:polysaccharide biosynthesis tyrosine autokinase [Myxococcota bacterium]